MLTITMEQAAKLGKAASEIARLEKAKDSIKDTVARVHMAASGPTHSDPLGRDEFFDIPVTAEQQRSEISARIIVWHGKLAECGLRLIPLKETTMFPITIRNKTTGEEKSFSNSQDVANYFATSGKESDWTGHEFTGPLPKPDPEFLRHHAEDLKRQAGEAKAAKPVPKAPEPKKPVPKKAAPKKTIPAKKAPAKKAAAKKKAKRK